MTATHWASNDALTVKLWSEDLYRQARKEAMLTPYMGKGANSLFEEKTDLVGKKGDKVEFGLVMNLTGEGIKSNQRMRGSEEALVTYGQEVVLDMRRNAVVSTDELSERRTVVNFRSTARDLLGLWMSEKTDQDMILALSGLANAVGTLSAVAPSTNRKCIGGQTSAGALTTLSNDLDGNDIVNDLFGTAVISAVKRKAQLASPKIRPLKYKGKPFYYMFIHPYQAKALKAETPWQQAQREANVRGEGNPMFSGALGIWDGVVIIENEQIESRLGNSDGDAATDPAAYFEAGDGAANNILCGRALFCGCQAGLMAWGRRPRWDEQLDDYNAENGICVSAIYMPAKARFNSEDFGVITVDTAMVAD